MDTINVAMERWELADTLALITASYLTKFPEEKIRPRTFFSSHPLGLEIPPSKCGERPVIMLGFPGFTDSSVAAMAAVVGAYAPRCARDNDGCYLRIVECVVGMNPRGGEPRLDLFFEFGEAATVYVVGGCNNYSGAGGAGGRKLELLFAFASSIMGVPITHSRIQESAWGGDSTLWRSVVDEVNRQETENR